MQDIILVQDRHDVYKISFADVERFHGFTNIAGAAIGFKALQAAFAQLFAGKPAPREEISIRTGHPGSGVRDAMEMVIRATTRGAYVVDTSLPKARLNPYRQLSFSFIATSSNGRQAEVILNEGILPARFFDLMEIVTQPDTDQEKKELDQLKRSLSKKIAALPAQELFMVTMTTLKSGL